MTHLILWCETLSVIQNYYSSTHVISRASLASSVSRGVRPNLPTEGRGLLSRVWSLSSSLKEGVVTSKAILKEWIEGAVRSGLI